MSSDSDSTAPSVTCHQKSLCHIAGVASVPKPENHTQKSSDLVRTSCIMKFFILSPKKLQLSFPLPIPDLPKKGLKKPLPRHATHTSTATTTFLHPQLPTPMRQEISHMYYLGTVLLLNHT